MTNKENNKEMNGISEHSDHSEEEGLCLNWANDKLAELQEVLYFVLGDLRELQRKVLAQRYKLESETNDYH